MKIFSISLAVLIVMLVEFVTCDKPTLHMSRYNPITGSMVVGSRIVKGTIVKEKQLPYQAALLFTDSAGETFVCGGAIISTTWILTAAHCTEGNVRVLVRVGSINFSSGGQAINSTNFIQHEQYNSTNLNNDIALINLSDTPITDKVAKAIKPVPKTKGCPSTPNILKVSGYGKTSDTSSTSEVLMQTFLTQVSTYDCVVKFDIESVPATVICAKGKNGEDSCQGDSGGPLVSSTGNLVGVVSYGGSSCEAGAVGVYTRVASFIDWIRVKTGLNFEK